MKEAAVRAAGLCVSFGGHAAIDGLDFSVDVGDFLAVLGPNGSGKSTLVKTILGINTPTAGGIEVFGRSPVRNRPEEIGYVPQIKTFDRTFPALAIELVVSGIRRRWPARLSADDTARGETALASVGAEHLSRRRIGSLSGGELQRIYLARS
ncbi:MAG: ATP-binding cassette domain-containing protein, partial [Rhodothermales bacterium]|nr:ATP-binding cassette domain-containing protein [Rhodothermales bacterium]